MNGLGGLNKSAHGVVVSLVQLQLPVRRCPAQSARCTLAVPPWVGRTEDCVTHIAALQSCA